MSKRRMLFAAVALAVAGCAPLQYDQSGQQLRLWGSNEVPPVTTQAYGTATVNIAADRSVTITLSLIDMVPTAANIHEGAAGANGPVIMPLTRISEQSFTAPQNAKITDAQYNAYKAGNLYINAHSAKYPDGEVRAQILGR